MRGADFGSCLLSINIAQGIIHTIGGKIVNDGVDSALTVVRGEIGAEHML